MRFTVDIADQIIADLATFLGKDALSEDEMRSMVEDTIKAKATEFVDISVNRRVDDAVAQIREQAETRKQEIASGISVE